jgi:hypothetical protein
MSGVLLFQLDGKIPNIALMRISAHHKALGDSVEFRWTGNPRRELWDNPKNVYGSSIFQKSASSIAQLKNEFPSCLTGGTGVDLSTTLESVGISTIQQDYSIYPGWRQSIGFTQRGCRLRCSFCVVPKKEGAMRGEQSVFDIWRGDPYPRELILLDNDFFGQPEWRARIKEIRSGQFKVSFNQGINARFLTDEAAEAIASIDYRGDDMKAKTIYTAWDNRKDEERLFTGLNRLVKYGVRPDHIMVYILIGYWPGETDQDWEYRRAKLREFGARPYPMPFTRTSLSVGFQRFCVGAYDKRITWKDFKSAECRPEKLQCASA